MEPLTPWKGTARSPKTCRSARASMASLKTVPVPCTETMSTSAASTPASTSAARIEATAPRPSRWGAVAWKASAPRPTPSNHARTSAPRSRARPADSSTSAAAPSPSSRPSRSVAKGRGRLADSAPSPLKPACTYRDRASTPATTTVDATPSSIHPEAVAKAEVPEAHAMDTVACRPLSPSASAHSSVGPSRPVRSSETDSPASVRRCQRSQGPQMLPLLVPTTSPTSPDPSPAMANASPTTATSSVVAGRSRSRSAIRPQRGCRRPSLEYGGASTKHPVPASSAARRGAVPRPAEVQTPRPVMAIIEASPRP